MKKRDLCSEIAEGFEALAEAREGKRTLRTLTVRIYRRDDVHPEWEPLPCDMQGAPVDTQVRLARKGYKANLLDASVVERVSRVRRLWS